eukprot:7740060-Ditylum_brightwellii.AAC.1
MPTLLQKCDLPTSNPLLDSYEHILLPPQSITCSTAKAVLQELLIVPADKRPALACITCATARPLSLPCGEWHNALSQQERAPPYMANSLPFIAMPMTATCP